MSNTYVLRISMTNVQENYRMILWEFPAPWAVLTEQFYLYKFSFIIIIIWELTDHIIMASPEPVLKNMGQQMPDSSNG